MKPIDGKPILKLVLTFFLVIAILWSCLVLSSLIPNTLLKDNFKKSADTFSNVEAFSFENGGKINSISDNYADSILLNLSYNMGRGNPLKATIDTDYYDGDEYGENYGLYATVNEDAPPNADYTRYWHGSAMFVRLFHTFTDVNGMRLTSFYIICFMVLLNLVLLINKKRYFVAASLVLSLCAVQFWNIALSLEYQATFAVCFALLPFYLLFEEKYPASPIYLSCISGTAVAFFDFLTAETITLLLPLIMVIAIRAKEGRAGTLKEIIFFALKCVLAWGIAYVMTFVVKWTAASLVTGTNCFRTALFSVSERFGGDFGGYFEQPQNIFSSVYANFGVAFGSKERNAFALSFVGTLIFLLVVFSVWYVFKSKQGEKNASLVVIALGMLVIIRFFVLNNHSFLHCFFTYRALCSLVFALLMALWLNIGKTTKAVKKKR